MRSRRPPQRLQVVPALQQRDNPTATAMLCRLEYFLRRPGEIILVQLQTGQRVGFVGIEPRRDEDEIGRKGRQARQDNA